VNDRTERDTNLRGGNIGRVVGWRASVSACSRVETAAEMVADEKHRQSPKRQNHLKD
jgi:hypothetical protein